VHSGFGKINYGGYKIQQLILGTGTVIWWVTEPHSFSQFSAKIFVEQMACEFQLFYKNLLQKKFEKNHH
jgi:hypothetical protein